MLIGRVDLLKCWRC